jgi:hypothetical protein
MMETTPLTPTQAEPAPRKSGKGRKGRKRRRRRTAAGAPRRPPSLNALDGGLRAKTFPLPHETAAAALRADVWHQRYRPSSPAACHLTNEAARATLLADRCDTFRQARLDEQARKTRKNFKRRGTRRVQRVVKRMDSDMLGAVHELATFSDGCRKLAGDLGDALNVLMIRGYLPPGDLEVVICQHGIWPIYESLATDVMAYTLYILNLGCTPGVAPEEIERKLDPASRPEALRALPREEVMPADPSACAARLAALIRTKRDAYQAEADRLAREVDAPALLALLQQEAILTEADAKRVARSHAEARITFDRAWSALQKTLDRDKEDEDEETEDDDKSDCSAPLPPANVPAGSGCLGVSACGGRSPQPGSAGRTTGGLPFGLRSPAPRRCAARRA